MLRHGTAKKILKVGAVSLPSDGYTYPFSVAFLSSSDTGPTAQRVKPDLVAPGVHENGEIGGARAREI